MSGSKKAKISESKLIKALAELENVAKGDPLEDADPEGGLSTEGEPLSDAAPKGRGEQTKKSRGGSPPFGSSSSSVASSESDDDDDEAPPPKPPKKDKGKKKDVSKARSMQSSASSKDSDDDDDDDDAEKSFREIAEGDETMRKAIVVNDFLESMVDQLSLALRQVSVRIDKSFKEMEDRISARINDSVTKSTSSQQAFNVRLATAIAAIGTTVQDDLVPMADMVKSLADQPAGSPRGKAVLTKGEVNQPPWSGGASVNADQRLANGSDDYVEDLRSLSTKAISDWLFKKSATSQLDPNVILAFEADRYDPAYLPSAVRKAIVDDLIK